MNFLWKSEEVFTSKFPLFWGFGCSAYLLWKVSFAGVGEAELQENGWSLFLPFCMAARSSGRPKGSSRLTLQSLAIHLEVLVSYSRAWQIPSLPPRCPAGFLPLQQHIFCRSGAIPPLAGAVCQPLWELLLHSWRHTSFEVKNMTRNSSAFLLFPRNTTSRRLTLSACEALGVWKRIAERASSYHQTQQASTKI